MYWYKRLTSRSPFHLAQINNLRQKLNLNSIGMNKTVSIASCQVLFWHGRLQKREMKNILQHTEVTINNFMWSYLHPLQSSRPNKHDEHKITYSAHPFQNQKGTGNQKVSLTINRCPESHFHHRCLVTGLEEKWMNCWIRTNGNSAWFKCLRKQRQLICI